MTSDAGESAGVSSGLSVFQVHEADASGRQTADVFRRRHHAGGRLTVRGPWQGEVGHHCGILLLATDAARQAGPERCAVRRQAVPAVRCRCLCENGTATAKLFAV